MKKTLRTKLVIVPVALLACVAVFATAHAKEVDRVSAKEAIKTQVKNIGTKRIMSREPILKAIDAIERRDATVSGNVDLKEKAKFIELREKATAAASETELRAIADEVQAGGVAWEGIVLKHLDRIQNGSYQNTMVRAERMRQYLEGMGESSRVHALLGEAYRHLSIAEARMERARRILKEHDPDLQKIKASVRPYLKDIIAEVKSANYMLLEIARIMNQS
ncbi:MAG: hypothetical protein AAB518_01720 [Patescibacteria group bacterium]